MIDYADSIGDCDSAAVAVSISANSSRKPDELAGELIAFAQ
jgi:hypothetical protein